MLNFSIIFDLCGTQLNIGGCGNYYIDNRIIFYDESGKDYEVYIGNASFCMSLEDIPFMIRRKINYTRSEMFITPIKGSSLYGKKEYKLYIPLKAVDFKASKPYSVKNDVWLRKYQKVEFNATNLHIYENGYYKDNKDIVKVDENRISVKCGFCAEFTKEFQKSIELTKEINRVCKTNFSNYDINTLLKYYSLEKR